MSTREQAMQQWLFTLLASDHYTYKPLTGDASFRRYYRLSFQEKSYIIMDAPPDSEPLDSFIAVAHLFESIGLKTPKIHECDRRLGFLLLEDFGDALLLGCLTAARADALYKQAIDQLIMMQQCKTAVLPLCDDAHIQQELCLFQHWFLEKYTQLALTSNEKVLLEGTFRCITNLLAQQPRVVIHRDYHARNIMVCPHDGTLALLDFQDAMLGPIAYDLVSLLKDCYIQWPRDKVLTWVEYFYKKSSSAQQYSLQDFIKAFDYCGLQRHLKVLGVFSRLHLRDNKSNYLQDLPLTLHYVKECLERYPELSSFNDFVQRIELP